MREPKVGDKIVVTEFDGEVIEPVIREIAEIDAETALLLMDKPLGDGERVIEHSDWMWNDEWRYAVRKGDRLVVTKMNGKSVDPTVVIAEESEFIGDGILELDKRVIQDDEDSWLLSLEVTEMDVELKEDDIWYFAEDYVAEHFTGVPEDAEIIAIESVDPINDICDSFNDVGCDPDEGLAYEVTDEERGMFGQSYSEFNAAQGGGKTLKDYTGVDITPETLGFVSDRDKTLEGITAESLAFEETVDNVNHPSHYNYGDIEVIDFIEQVAGSYEDGSVAYMLGNTIKYVSRAPHKNGAEDLRKAAFYLNRAIERVEDAK